MSNVSTSAISEDKIVEYAKAFVAGPGKAAVATHGFNQSVASYFAAFVLVKEGMVEKENFKDCAALLASHGLGTNASQMRQKLEKKGVIAARTPVGEDLVSDFE